MKGSSTAPLLIGVVIVGVGITAFMMTMPQQTVTQVEAGIDEVRTVTEANTFSSYVNDGWLREAIDFNFEATTYDMAQKGGGFPLWTPEEQNLTQYAIPNVTEIEEQLERGARNRFERRYFWSQNLGGNDWVRTGEFPYEIRERYDIFNGSHPQIRRRPIDIIFIVEGGSNTDSLAWSYDYPSWNAFCGQMNELVSAIEDEGLDVKQTRKAVNVDINNLPPRGGANPFDVPAVHGCASRDGKITGSEIDHDKDWGDAVEKIAEDYSGWRSGAYRVIAPIVTTCPEGTNKLGINQYTFPCNLNPVDDMVDAANNNDIHIYPINPTEFGRDDAYQGPPYNVKAPTYNQFFRIDFFKAIEDAAAGTGGRIWHSSEFCTSVSGPGNPTFCHWRRVPRLSTMGNIFFEAARWIKSIDVTNAGGTNFSGWSREPGRFQFRSEYGNTYTETYVADKLNNVSRGNRYFYQYNISQTFAHSRALRTTLSRAAHNVSNIMIVDVGKHVGECDVDGCDERNPSRKPNWYPGGLSGSWNGTIEEAMTNKQEREARTEIRDRLEGRAAQFMKDFNESQENYRQYKDISLTINGVDVEYEIIGDIERIDRFDTRTSVARDSKDWIVDACLFSGGCGGPPTDPATGDPVGGCNAGTWEFKQGFKLSNESLQRGSDYDKLVTEDPWYLERRAGQGVGFAGLGPQGERNGNLVPPANYDPNYLPFDITDITPGHWDPPGTVWVSDGTVRKNEPRMVSHTKPLHQRELGAREYNSQRTITPVFHRNPNPHLPGGSCKDPYFYNVVQRWRNGWWYDKLNATVSVKFTVQDEKWDLKVAPFSSETYYGNDYTGQGLRPQRFTVRYQQNQTVSFHRDGTVDEFHYPSQSITWTRSYG